MSDVRSSNRRVLQLAGQLSEAVAKDEQGAGCDIGAGMVGFHVHAWLQLIDKAISAHETNGSLVLRITTAYEHGFGQAGRDLTNPYIPLTPESEAWNIGVQQGIKRLAVEPTERICLNSLKGHAGDKCPLCGDGPCPHVKTSGAAGHEAIWCTLTKGCWLESGHDGHCD